MQTLLIDFLPFFVQSEERLEIYQEKLEKIRSLKDELKSHIAALPDIPQVRVTKTTGGGGGIIEI
jgi:hypothetical protein